MKTFFLLIISNSILLFSIEAFDGIIIFKNDDNTTFKAQLFGDESFSWIENNNKDVIVYNSESKNYEYATLQTQHNEVELVATGIKVTSENSNFLQKLTYTKFKINRKNLIEIWRRKREQEMNLLSK